MPLRVLFEVATDILQEAPIKSILIGTSESPCGVLGVFIKSQRILYEVLIGSSLRGTSLSHSGSPIWILNEVPMKFLWGYFVKSS